MKNLSIILFFLMLKIIVFSQNHDGIFSVDINLVKAPKGFVWTNNRLFAVKQYEVSIDDYLTFIENVARDSSENYLDKLIPTEECALLPYIHNENGYFDEDPINERQIPWIDENNFLSDYNYPSKEKIKGFDKSLLNPYIKPITGISFEQANLYANWCTVKFNEIMYENEIGAIVNFRLPTPLEYGILEQRGIEECELKDPILCENNSNALKNCKNEKGCALCNCAQKDSCESNILGIKYFGNELYPVSVYHPNWLGLYNLQGNAAEMTNEIGIAKGGSYLQTAEQCLPESVQLYGKPEKWLGFRLVAELLDEATKTPLINSINNIAPQKDSTIFKPEISGDYFFVMNNGGAMGNFIVRETGKKLWADYHSLMEVEDEDEWDSKKMEEIFNNLDRLKIENMLTLQEKYIPEDDPVSTYYSNFEYRKNGMVYRICWNNRIFYPDESELGKLVEFLSSLDLL